MYYEEETLSPQALQAKKRKKQQQVTILVALILVGGLAYYFLGYLPEERSRTKEEINEAFKDNWNVLPEKLDKTLWEGAENWEAQLESLFLPSQVKVFGERMIKAIERKAEELEQEEKDKPRKMREEAIKDIEKFAKKELERSLSLKDTIEKIKKKINNTPVNDLSSITEEANKFITQQKNKRQKLHWLRKAENWADKKLEILQQEFDQAWNQLNGIVNPHKEPDKEPEKCTFAASYTINFPPSLWNDLSEEEKNHERAKVIY